ncbi:MAG TPA: hypothetical protein VGV17_02985 [Bosea sp. (in: a-proteobacteria)]|jgi:hypothetical protein|uniref:hypothetical protein n=1 Tax=Bosea sp. (in: a-proteobacteria) TaxID=1871050 RepID=UPI002DDD0F4F|nr:hypothetical protein [Bosea sp. (in: a-proteobacteria)]HEV2552710.1 hypothetical protein [Bosea sp. (in: a-proteobacteria)]
MTAAAWPDAVPYQGPVDSIAFGPSYAAPLSSETESGPALPRPRPGPRSTEYPWQSRLLTRAQWDAFEAFARVTLRQGTLPFTMKVWRPEGCYVDRLCQIKDGLWQTDTSAAPRVRISFTRIVWNL